MCFVVFSNPKNIRYFFIIIQILLHLASFLQIVGYVISCSISSDSIAFRILRCFILDVFPSYLVYKYI